MPDEIIANLLDVFKEEHGRAAILEFFWEASEGSANRSEDEPRAWCGALLMLRAGRIDLEFERL